MPAIFDEKGFGLQDESGYSILDEAGFSAQLVKTTATGVNSDTSLTSSALITSCVAGQPYQGDMRQLATDRWNYMYPS